MLFIVLHPGNIAAQAVIPAEGEIVNEISTIISGIGNLSADVYAAPNNTQLNYWGEALEYLIGGDYDSAALYADSVDYDVIRFVDTSNESSPITYYVLKTNGANYWGTYVLNPGYSRPLVIQSPHPEKDFRTGEEGIHVFHETGAFFFMLSGTDRCNSTGYSTCSNAQTSICIDGLDTEKYRISDVTRNLSTIFQNTTDTLFNKYSNTYFLQLHGFTKKLGDPFIILSNGTDIAPSSTDYIATLKTQLMGQDTLFNHTDSIRVAHMDTDWDRLVGFTNVQGRLINSSNNLCNSDATTTNGRFIHMEQEKWQLRNDVTGWDKVATAVENTFPFAVLPITLLHFKVHNKTDQYVTCEWSTASEINNDYFTIEHSNDMKHWEEIAKVDGAENSSNTIDYSYIDKAPYVGISYYRLKQTDFDGKYSYSQIESVKINRLNNQVSIYPNPSKRYLIMEASKEELEHISVNNIYGKNVMNQIAITINSNTKITLNLSNLKSGAYIVKTKTTVNKVYKQ